MSFFFPANPMMALSSAEGSSKFWNELKIYLPREAAKADEARFNKLKNLEIDFDIDDFFDLKEFRSHPISQEDLSRGKVSINGESVFDLIEEKPRFYFSPTRFKIDLSSTGLNLEVVPTYRFFEKEIA